MNKALFAAIVASTFGLGAISAFGADMTNDERSEMRQRADRLLAERARNPSAQSDVRLDRPRGDVRLDRTRGEVKMKAKRAKAKVSKATKSKRTNVKASVKKSKRSSQSSLREVPGALVRR
jgi:hypothetical protein